LLTSPRPLLVALTLLLVAHSPKLAAASQPRMLPDSTITESWTLSNGLRVVTQFVPNAKAVSIAVSYRIGRDDDPADRRGLAALLAEVVLTSEAGSAPARTREELASLRAMGWNLETGPAFTTFVEAAAPGQLAGVLRQAAARMRGVAVTEPGLRKAVASVKRDLAWTYSDELARALRAQVRELAARRGAAAVGPLALGSGLDRVSLQEVRQRIAREYVPANAVLAVAGDFHGVDFHTLIESEFSGIPAGTARRSTILPLDSVSVALVRPQAQAPVGVVGIVAPALTDSLHSSFYLTMLLLGTHVSQTWGPAPGPMRSRFQFSVLDDPRFARFYPPVGVDTKDPKALGDAMRTAIDELVAMTVTLESYDELRSSVLWILGGPMPAPVKRAVLSDPRSLNLIATNLAARAQWGDEAFWADYRRRMDPRVSPGFGYWIGYIGGADHQARLLALPKK
jgi:hypothetical protein